MNNTKSFYGPSVEEVLATIKKELGDPVITQINHKRPLLGRKMVEVVASLDPSQRPNRQISKHGRFSVMDDEVKPGFAPSFATSTDELPTRTTAPTAPIPVEQRAPQAETKEDIEEKLDEVKDLMKRTLLATEARNSSSIIRKKASSPLLSFTEDLAEKGISAEIIELMTRVAIQKLTPAQASNPHTLNDFARQFTAYLMKKCGHTSNNNRIALIGPTGVGKTTTLAKLAADMVINQKKDVGLITIDVFRIAAAEQLMVYSKIMDLPIKVAETPDQLRSALEEFKHKDAVLIDTSGRSPQETESIDEMKHFFRPEFNIELNLVLSATTREKELYTAAARFNTLPVSNVIFTKLDECEDLGALLNFYMSKQIPISFLANGQRVPEDLVQAEPKETAKLIIGA